MSSEVNVVHSYLPPLTASTESGRVRLPLMAKKSASHDVTVRLQYLRDLDLYKTVKPLQFTPNLANRNGKTNIVLTPGELETIRDVRGCSEQFSLDDHGFVYSRAPTKVEKWNSQPTIANDYLPEMEELLKRNVEDCDEIIFYDARIRQQTDQGVRIQGLSFNPFARQVHTDNTARSIIDKIRNLTDLKSEYLSRGRCRAINIWRPIKHPVYDCPLAVADGGKLWSEDIIECDRRRQDTGAYWDTMGVVKFRRGFEWYYMSHQTEDDVLLFKNYDTATNAKARCCLHTAFDMPTEMIPMNAPTRESIEVRALVFTYPKTKAPPSDLVVHHPLIDSLKQSRLTSFDNHTQPVEVVPRIAIDEYEEIKDAGLLLPKQRIRELELAVQQREQQYEALRAEHKTQANELKLARNHLDCRVSKIVALQLQVRELMMQCGNHSPECQAHGHWGSAGSDVSHVGEESRWYDEEDGAQWVQDHYGNGGEILLLRQTIDAKDKEICRLKNQLLGRAANLSSDQVWQTSVSETLRLERVKDAFVVEAMRNALLKHGDTLDNLPKVTLDEHQFGSQADRDACEVDALRQRLDFLLGRRVDA